MKALVIALVVAASCAVVGCSTLLPPQRNVTDLRSVDGAVFPVYKRDGPMGTAWVVHGDNTGTYLVTAEHVVRRRTPMYDRDGVKEEPFIVAGLPATILYTDPEADLALLRVSPGPSGAWPILSMRRGSLPMGFRAFARGWTRWDGEMVRVNSVGFIVSANWGSHLAYNGGGQPGMSGCPVVDADGSVTGVLVAAPTAWGQANTSLLLCVPVERVRQFLREAKVPWAR